MKINFDDIFDHDYKISAFETTLNQTETNHRHYISEDKGFSRILM
jgi:hypothetical protein